MNNKKIEYGFVILHYLALDITIQCVDDLLRQFSKQNILIVIVDNASPNKSGTALIDKYKDNTLVKVLSAPKNLGFARGNNIGYEYLKKNYDTEFMIVMNNDVFIKTDTFLEKISQIYNEYHFAVLGPDIYAPNLNRHQNPLERVVPTVNDCEYWISVYKKLIRKDNFNYYKLKILHYLFYWWAKPIIKALYPSILEKKEEKHTNLPNSNAEVKTDQYERNILENIVLQGACLIFSKDFIQKRDYAFYPETFLYLEEHILALQCFREGYKTLYHPDINVTHLCAVSTSQAYKQQRQKDQLYWNENIKSLKVYIKLYKEYERKCNG